MKVVKSLLVLLALLSSGHSKAMTNEQLIDYCQQAAAVIDVNNIQTRLIKPYSQCHAFIDGFLAGFVTGPAILTGAKKIRMNDWPVCVFDINSHQLAVELLRYVRDGGEYSKEKGANTILTSIIFERYRYN